jgi:hypothetical protein
MKLYIKRCIFNGWKSQRPLKSGIWDGFDIAKLFLILLMIAIDQVSQYQMSCHHQFWPEAPETNTV